MDITIPFPELSVTQFCFLIFSVITIFSSFLLLIHTTSKPIISNKFTQKIAGLFLLTNLSSLLLLIGGSVFKAKETIVAEAQQLPPHLSSGELSMIFITFVSFALNSSLLFYLKGKE